MDWATVWTDPMDSAPAWLAALVVCLIAARLSWRLYKNASAQCSRAMFEERYELFVLLRNYLSRRIAGPERAEPLHTDLSHAQHRYYCLFDRRIGDLVSAALDRGSEQDMVWSEGHSRAVAFDRTSAQLAAWFSAEATGLRKRFDPYLSAELSYPAEGRWQR